MDACGITNVICLTNHVTLNQNYLHETHHSVNHLFIWVLIFNQFLCACTFSKTNSHLQICIQSTCHKNYQQNSCSYVTNNIPPQIIIQKKKCQDQPSGIPKIKVTMHPKIRRNQIIHKTTFFVEVQLCIFVEDNLHFFNY